MYKRQARSISRSPSHSVLNSGLVIRYGGDTSSHDQRKAAAPATEQAEPATQQAEPATEQVEPATEQANKFKKLEALVDDSAAEFLCAITQELPIDPVTAEDGRVYERSAIEEWLTKNEKSPHTNEPMGKKLLPALQVKNMIASMVKSGALSGDKCAAWTQKLEQEKEVEEVREFAQLVSDACFAFSLLEASPLDRRDVMVVAALLLSRNAQRSL